MADIFPQKYQASYSNEITSNAVKTYLLKQQLGIPSSSRSTIYSPISIRKYHFTCLQVFGHCATLSCRCYQDFHFLCFAICCNRAPKSPEKVFKQAFSLPTIQQLEAINNAEQWLGDCFDKVAK
jgi:hypothetical protein